MPRGIYKRQVKDLAGLRIGRLIVIRYNEQTRKWVCQCDCGNFKEIKPRHLAIYGTTRSCGCLGKEIAQKLAYINGKNNLTHGMRQTKQYAIWSSMLKRCQNPNDAAYENYGGRGIRVCERWQRFENFWEDMKEGYKDGLTIDRTNNNGDYEPQNCKWVTRIEQNNNTRNNTYFEIDGQTFTVAELSRKYKMNYGTLISRLRRGWNIQKALI